MDKHLRYTYMCGEIKSWAYWKYKQGDMGGGHTERYQVLSRDRQTDSAGWTPSSLLKLLKQPKQLKQ